MCLKRAAIFPLPHVPHSGHAELVSASHILALFGEIPDQVRDDSIVFSELVLDKIDSNVDRSSDCRDHTPEDVKQCLVCKLNDL
jgi:hypothetical protein